jgi:hypothetical protein
MQLMVSRRYPVVDAQARTEYVARAGLFRTAEGSYCLYLAMDQVEGEERVLFLDSRVALLWLNETPDALGSYWHFARRNSALCSTKPRLVAFAGEPGMTELEVLTAT